MYEASSSISTCFHSRLLMKHEDELWNILGWMHAMSMSMSMLRALLEVPSSSPRRLWRDAHFIPRPVVTRSVRFGASSSFACRATGKSSSKMEAQQPKDTSLDGAQKQQSPKKLLTLVIVQKEDKVLLGMKKRGFGAGYFNGFGGKVEANETIDEAAVRELEEECGVVPLSMQKRGVLTFHFDDNPQPWEVHVYHVGEYAGEPVETDEMAPRWFSLGEIPYEKMWQDDPIWYPEFLSGRFFRGEFYFHDTHTLVSHSLHVLQKLDA